MTVQVDTFEDGQLVHSATYTRPVEQTNADTLREQALQAMVNNRTFLALATPTNAQTVAQVKALTRQNNAIIRMLLGHFNGTD